MDEGDILISLARCALLDGLSDHARELASQAYEVFELLAAEERREAAAGAREEAEQLAHEIARFPQGAVRADRRSAYETHGLPVREALKREWLNGMPTMAEAVAGAGRFAGGKGRHGDFGSI